MHGEVWRHMTKPRFSGQPQDYARFEADWEELERAYREAVPCPPSEYMLLAEFKTCLDEATQVKLRVRMRQNPSLTLTEFKRELRNEFGVDTQRQHRRDWEGVVLPLTGPPGRELTLQDWRRFESLYKLHRESVPERSATEECRMIFVKLPAKWQEELIREQSKRRKRRHWVRVTYPPGLDLADVVAAAELHLQEPLPTYRECASGFIVENSSGEIRDRLLQLHNARVDGVRISASRHEYEMTGDEILAFVYDRLQTEEEIQVTRETFGCAQPVPKPSTATVKALETGPANLQVAKMGEGQHDSRNASRGGQNRNWKGRKSPSSPKDKNRPAASAPPSGDSVCRTCRSQGRAFVHNYRTCEHFIKAKERLALRNPSLARGQCWTCVDAGRPADHDFHKCEHSLARKNEKAQAGRPKSPAGSPRPRSE